MFIRNFQNNIKMEGAGDGGSGGSAGSGSDAKFTQSDIDKAIETAISGLKTKNTEILGEKKKIEDRLKAFGDLDPVKVKELYDRFENSEEAKLLKEGKIDELLEKKMSKEKTKWEESTKELMKKLELLESTSVNYKNKYDFLVVNHAITKAAIEAGIRKEAADDVVSAAINLFSVGEDGEIEARDSEGNLRKIGDKIMDIPNWIESLKATKPHYWPDSQGAGLQGNKGNQNISGNDLSAKINAAAAAGDMATYRKLRQEQMGKGKK